MMMAMRSETEKRSPGTKMNVKQMKLAHAPVCDPQHRSARPKQRFLRRLGCGGVRGLVVVLTMSSPGGAGAIFGSMLPTTYDSTRFRIFGAR